VSPASSGGSVKTALNFDQEGSGAATAAPAADSWQAVADTVCAAAEDWAAGCSTSSKKRVRLEQPPQLLEGEQLNLFKLAYERNYLVRQLARSRHLWSVSTIDFSAQCQLIVEECGKASEEAQDSGHLEVLRLEREEGTYYNII
jgi:hypothetical protein